MAFNYQPGKWEEWYGSGTFPELLDLFQKQIDAKKKSRIIIKKKDIVWDAKHPQAKSASVIDPRLGFANSLANMGLSQIDPGKSTGKHKHGEAMIYVVSGRGYSIIDGKRYDWEEGDGMYIPPETFHQHFNLDQKNPAVYLRIVPGVLQLNLLAVATALNIGPSYNIEQAETSPGFKGSKSAKEHMRG
jgi:quercetin dioxygenase-like cupin family protein